MVSYHFEAKKQQKQHEAKVRQTESKQLSPQARLAELDRRLGKGVGAGKERAQLQKLIASQPAAPVPVAEPAPARTTAPGSVSVKRTEVPANIRELQQRLDLAISSNDRKAQRALERHIRRAQAQATGGGTGTGG